MVKKAKAGTDSHAEAKPKAETLFASSKQLDPALASLFATSTVTQPVAKKQKLSSTKSIASQAIEKDDDASSKDEDEEPGSEISSDSGEESEEKEPSSSSSVESAEDSGEELEDAEEQAEVEQSHDTTYEDSTQEGTIPSRRKRKRENEDLESKYMQQLADEEAREEVKRQQERKVKHLKGTQEASSDEESTDEMDIQHDQDVEDAESDEGEDAEIPQHESLSKSEAPEIEKANRTVFLGNVAVEALTSKQAKKTLARHMSSKLEGLPTEKIAHKIESIRFRSTAYTNMLPKKASFVTQDVMEATTKSTNAYVVYTTKTAARAALKLNGTIVLARHLRVDSVAHPGKTDPRRCVFVGNLGFVDDESAVQAAEDEESKKKRKSKKKEPSDIEEGLWREFGKCGAVENVRVVRDSKTRVGKGFAYVQFLDENAVEAALLYDGKKFPPMLPRKLRVMRAKGMKRNSTKKDTWSRPATNGVYNPKINPEQKSALGRASKLLGRAGAAMVKQPDGTGGDRQSAGGFKAPESFVFEGHRATKDSYINSKKRPSKKKEKPNNRSTKRAAAWKFGGAEK